MSCRVPQIVPFCHPGWENMVNIENVENMEKMDNIKQMTYNTVFVTQNTLFGNQMTQNTFMLTVEKSEHTR